MYMRNTKFFKVIYTGLGARIVVRTLLRQSQEFPLMYDASGLVHGKVSMMHLIYHYIIDILHHRTMVITPSLRIRLGHIYDCCTFAIGTYSLCIYSRSFIEPSPLALYLEGIELTVKFLRNSRTPYPFIAEVHFKSVCCHAVAVCIIEKHAHILRCRRP